MKHVVRKAFIDYEKEEKFLNKMSSMGLALTDYSWCRYVFEDAPKGEYIYRIELLENLATHPESRKYIEFMEETGAEFVCSYFRWVYFRRKASEGEFNIYSDIDSRMKHYKRIFLLFFVLTAANLAAGISNLLIGVAQQTFNLYLSILSFSLTAVMTIALLIPTGRRIRRLKKEKYIRE